MSEQLKRITEMEDALNETEALSSEMRSLLTRWEDNLPNFQKLFNYYYGEIWQKDFDFAKENRMLQGFPHGVLSEDGAYNALSDFRELSLRMLKAGVKGVE